MKIYHRKEKIIMGEAIDQGSYQEVIMQLKAYSSKVAEQTTNMRCSANACAQTMEGDPVADRSVEALNRVNAQINQGLTRIHAVMSGMQRELEDAQNAAAKADFNF